MESANANVQMMTAALSRAQLEYNGKKNLRLRLPNGTLYEHTGRVESISGVVDERTGAVSVCARFDNPDGMLLSGGTGKIVIPTELHNAIVILQENGFAPLAKPGGARFDACADGRLLLLAPWPHHNRNINITRDKALTLNQMAWAICSQHA